MKIVILGLGSMGKEVVRSALLDGHEIIAQIDPIATNASNKELTDDIAQKADIAIEFTIASAVLDNAKKYAAMDLPAVVGTTGWSKDFEKVSSINTLLSRIRRIVEALIPLINGFSPIKTKISIKANGVCLKTLEFTTSIYSFRI